jgi:hypothetical protein
MTRKERKLKEKSIGLIALLLCFSFSMVAQNPTKLSLQNCLDHALKNNKLITTGNLEVQAAEAFIGTGRELPKGSLDFQYGKTQTYFSQDYTIIANQNIPWPSLLKAQVKSLSSQKMVAEKRLKITQNLVASSVKWYYYLLMVQQKNHEFLQKQDSIYAQMNDANFDKNVLTYIPASSPAYFTSNINLQQTYEQAYKILLPLLSDEKNAQIAERKLKVQTELAQAEPAVIEAQESVSSIKKNHLTCKIKF